MKNKITSIIYYSKWNSYSAKDYMKISYNSELRLRKLVEGLQVERD